MKHRKPGRGSQGFLFVMVYCGIEGMREGASTFIQKVRSCDADKSSFLAPHPRCHGMLPLRGALWLPGNGRYGRKEGTWLDK